VCEFSKKVYFLSSVTAFAELAHKCRYYCELHTTEVWNGPELSTTMCAVLSLVCAGWTELTSEIFCPNCFLHFGYQKCFPFMNCLTVAYQGYGRHGTCHGRHFDGGAKFAWKEPLFCIPQPLTAILHQYSTGI